MPTLPTPGGDNNTWGTELNDWLAKGGQVYNVKDGYNATGLGVADDSAAIQAAIDAANAAGGGVVYVPPGTYRCNVTLKERVIIKGHAATRPDFAGWSTILQQAAAGAVIDTPAGATNFCGVEDIRINGLGSGTAGKGIYFRNQSGGAVRRVAVHNMADEGVRQDAGGACIYEDVVAVNVVLNRTRSAFIGAVDLSGADIWLNRIEATISGSIEGTKQSANLWCVGVAVKAHNCFLDAVVGEISDIGIYVSGSYNRFSNCRADLNYGHGFYVVGGQNQFANCLGFDNSQDTTNTYDNWHFTSSSLSNTTAGCLSGATPQAKVHRYGFYDDSQTATDKNRHSNPLDDGAAATAPFRSSTNYGAAFGFPASVPLVLTYGTTVSTDASLGAKHFNITVSNGTAFTIANPTKMVPGQEITYIIGNFSGGAMGAITWGAAFKLAGAFTNPANNKYRIISFVYDGTSWFETNRAAADI